MPEWTDGPNRHVPAANPITTATTRTAPTATNGWDAIDVRIRSMASPLPFIDLRTTSDERLAVGAGAERPRAGPAAADRLGGETGHRQDARDTAREECFVGIGQVAGRQPRLVRLQADACGPANDPVAGRARQDRARERRRRELIAANQKQVRRCRLRQEAVGRQEDRVVGAGLAGLDAGEDVIRARGRLQPDQRVLGVAAHGARDEVEAVLEVADRNWRHGPGLDDDRRRWVLVGREEAAAEEPPARDGDADAGIALGPVQAFAGEDCPDGRTEPRLDVVRQ